MVSSRRGCTPVGHGEKEPALLEAANSAPQGLSTSLAFLVRVFSVLDGRQRDPLALCVVTHRQVGYPSSSWLSDNG